MPGKAFLLLAVLVSAQPENLGDGGRLIPATAYPNGPVVPRRTDVERGLAGNRFVYVPVMAASLTPIAGAENKGWVRSILRLDTFRYPIRPPNVDTVALYERGLQHLIDTKILAAVARLPELGPVPAIAVTVNDVETTYVSVPPATEGAARQIIVDYGLTHAITAHAYSSFYLDQFMFTAESRELEDSYDAFERYLNAYAFVIGSENGQQEGGDRFFDQGVVDSVYPGIEYSWADRGSYSRHFEYITLAVMAHEVCHILLRHEARPADRKAVETSADLCAARIFTEATAHRAGNDPNQRYSYVATAARYLAQLSFLTWPDEAVDDYPDPAQRFAAVMDAFPVSQFPGLDPEFARFSRMMEVLVSDPLLQARKVALGPFEKGDAAAEAGLHDALIDQEISIIDYCKAAECMARLDDDNREVRFPMIRALMDLAAVRIERRRRGELGIEIAPLRSFLDRILSATDERMPRTRERLGEMMALLGRM